MPRPARLACGLVAALALPAPAAPVVPAACTQLILVEVANPAKSAASVRLLERTTGRWTTGLGPFPARIGAAGCAWGTSPLFSLPVAGVPRKAEGDGKSPAGIFSLGAAYGKAPVRPPSWRWPYRAIDAHLICVDDPGSRYYNRIVDERTIVEDRRDWKSREQLLRDDVVYKWLLEVRHNWERPVPGGGSAIFLHVWDGPGVATAGCTALDEARLLGILRRLDPARHPCFVLLPPPSGSLFARRVLRELGRY